MKGFSRLESEREKLLTELQNLVPPDLQARIDEALAASTQSRRFEIRVSYLGTADADAE